MPVRDAMRVRLAIACALAVVLLGATAIAITLSRRGASESSVASGAAAAPVSGCQVTRPNGSTAPGERPSDAFYGSEGLWTLLPPDGVLRIATTFPVAPGATFGEIHRDGSLSTKFPWWGSRSAAARLTIRGTRLDGHARFRLTAGPGATARSPHFWPTRIRFARRGCWRVTAKSGRASLRFTIFVRRAGD